ncbi:hypothetical protein MOSE0_M00100 [Monosporozyma servazzii]
MLLSIDGLMLRCGRLIPLVLAEDMQISDLNTAIINYMYLNQVIESNVLWKNSLMWCLFVKVNNWSVLSSVIFSGDITINEHSNEKCVL